MSITVLGRESTLAATIYIVPVVDNVTLPIECRNLSLSLHQTKKTHLSHSRTQASTEADYPAARNGNINLSPPHEDAIGSSYGMRLI